LSIVPPYGVLDHILVWLPAPDHIYTYMKPICDH